MLKVFISHSTEDLEIVSIVSNSLKLIGVNVYVAEFYPEPGKILRDKILENLKSSDCVIVLLTHFGAKSTWVQQEIGIAKTLGKPIIPLLEKGVSVKGVLEGVEYIPLDLKNINAAVERLIESISQLKEKLITYSTSQAAKLLGVSFITIKRWIYSGKISATKNSSGRYRISKDEIERLQAELKKRARCSQFSRDIIDLVKEKRIVYLRELQICLEDAHTHRDTYNKVNQLVPSMLQTKFYNGNRWYFPLNLKWQDVKDVAKKKSELMNIYVNHPRRFERHSVVYMDYSELLVEAAMIQAGYTVVAKDAYYFHGIAYRQNGAPGRPKDLDFIARIPKKDIYVGVQIKNRLEYPKHADISELLDICNVLHLRPVLVARRTHPMSYRSIRNAGGDIIECKRYFLQPPFPRKEFKEIVGMGIPLGVYKWTPDFLVESFDGLSKKFK
jgi:excisionase family DNA binding protein